MATTLGFSDAGCRRFSLPLVLLLFFALLAGRAGAGDRDTLLAVSMDWGAPTQLETWNPAAAPDHCSWAGVACGGSGGVVTGLVLPRLSLNGTVPASVCALKNLTRLDLSYNNLSGAFPATALYACTKLRFLDLSNNHFSGPLPRDIDRLSPAMEHLNLSSNRFAGEVPPGVASFVALRSLRLYNNDRFSGGFPAKIWSLPELTLVKIQNNRFTGTLPAQIPCKISRIEMGNNMFSGWFPTSAPGLKVFHAENNRLGGKLPSDMSKLANLADLSVPGNRITGSIPASIKLLQKLTVLDLSHNMLTGSIPSDISSCSMIKKLNLSSNQLTGEVPAQLLQNAAYNKSFLGNPGLCSSRAGSSGLATNLPTCRGGRNKQLTRGLIILLAAMLAGVVLVGSIGIGWMFLHQRTKTDWDMHEMSCIGISQATLCAKDVVSSLGNEIGTGGSGKVYRVHLGTHDDEEDGAGRMVLAVKRLRRPRNRDDGEDLDKQFEAEAKVLGSKLRHNNIVRLLCCMSSQQEQAKLLVYEYMEKGSLDRWIHHPGRDDGAALDWPTRLGIAVDVAKGLSYMHHDCYQPIVHCDVKSSNILLGPAFNAKIADFGLARTLSVGSGFVPDGGGTPGYIAPEIRPYGPEVNEKIDVYSFGVVLLELTTGRKATDGGSPHTGLAGWARLRYEQEGATFDDDIVHEAIRNPTDIQAIQSVFTLGVMCTSHNPLERPSMEEVLRKLTLLQQCRQTQIISAETTEEVVYDDGGAGGGAPLLQSRRRTTAPSEWIRRQFSSLLTSTGITSSSTTRRSILSARSSFRGLQLLQRRSASFARIHGTRAHTN